MTVNLNKQGEQFDKAVLSALTGLQNVFLFDNSVVSVEVPRYIDNIIELCEVTVRKPYQFWGGHVSESSLLASIGENEQKGRAAPKEDGPELSNYRLLCDALERQETGVVVVHNAEKLRNESIHILARLAAFAKRMQLRWQFLLFADLAGFDDLLLMQLHVDKYYPTAKRPLAEAEEPGSTVEFEEFVYNKPSKTPVWGVVALLSVVVVLVVSWFQSRQAADYGNSQSTGLEQQTSSNEAADLTQDLVERQRRSRLQAVHELRVRDLEFNKVLKEIEGQDINSEADSGDTAVAPDTESETILKFVLPIAQQSSSALKPSASRPSTLVKMSDRMLVALDSSDVQVVKHLYERGEDKNAVNKTGETALAIAVIANDQNLVSQLIAFQAPINTADQNGHSPLFYAAIGGSRQMTQQLLAAGASVNSLSSLNKTPLMAAAHNAHTGLVKLFIERGAKLNLQDHSGWTALQYAAWNNNLELVELLLEQGADPRLRDKDGYDAQEISELRGHTEMAALISQIK